MQLRLYQATKNQIKKKFQDYDLCVALALCLWAAPAPAPVDLAGLLKMAQQPETFGDGGSMVGSTSTDLYGFGSALCCCSVFSLSSSSFVFTGLSSPDNSLSSQTSPDDPDLLNDTSDLGNASISFCISMFVMVVWERDLRLGDIW
uniref:Uncharacterized protein n=1 Tax=Lactuca sativa TaxID=4236 RepID=A0A9R1UR14_LACSA|nr:hypothetical protein LSAT_V11C800412920 [Lactuca sativa]